MKLLNSTPPNILKALDIDVTKTKKSKVIKYIALKSLARITLSLLCSYPRLLKHHLKPMCWVALWLHVMPLLRMLACMKIWCDAVCACAVIWSLLCQDKSFLLKIICYSVTNLSYAWLHLMHTVSDFLSDDLLNRLQKSRSDMQNIARRGFQMH